jgi:hypothetical protein
MVLEAREPRKRPDHERRKLQRKLDQQTDQLKEFGKDRAIAEAVVEEWRENARERLEMISDIAFPMDAPKDPTSAAVLLGRIQGFMEPLRKAYDTLGLTGQMQTNLDKTRDQLNDLGEEVFDDDN